MGTNDRGRLSIDPNSDSYVEYNPGTKQLEIYASGSQVATVKIDSNERFATGPQAAAIADPTGGTTVDAEARSAINDILAALRGFGIIAT